jgi:hypothetical protein
MTELCGVQRPTGRLDGKTEKLPSAHRYFLAGAAVLLPRLLAHAEACEKGERYIEALRKHKRIVLTDDEVLADPMLNPNGEQSLFRRKGYIAVYDIDDIVADDKHGLRFTLIK